MAINLPPTPAVCLLLVSLPLLVILHSKSSLTGHAIFKVLSSIAFTSGPLLRLTSASSTYHQLMTCGLLCSVIGDILLIPSKREYYNSHNNTASKTNEPPKISVSFQLGILAFAAAHVAYIVAFLRAPQTAHTTPSWTAFTTVFLTTMVLAKYLGVIYPNTSSSQGLFGGNALNLSIAADMRPLVLIYATIISTMLAVAISTTPTLQHQRVLGAIMFVLSDLFVAKDAFGVKKTSTSTSQVRMGRRDGWLQTGVGWILYFWGQMILAGTVEGIY